MSYRVREGETGNQDFTLEDEQGPFDATGGTISLELVDRAGGRVNTSGKVVWIVEANGTVRVNCAAADLVKDRGPYQATFIVTLVGATYAFPSTGPMKWEVWK